MPTLNVKYNWGSRLKNENPELYRQLSDSYEDISNGVNSKSSVYQTTSDPPSNNAINRNFSIGDLWVRTDTNTAWIMTSRTSDTAATWTQIT